MGNIFDIQGQYCASGFHALPVSKGINCQKLLISPVSNKQCLDNKDDQITPLLGDWQQVPCVTIRTRVNTSGYTTLNPFANCAGDPASEQDWPLTCQGNFKGSFL